MKLPVIAIILAFCVAACTAMENYRFGDITRTVLETAAQVAALKTDYCAAAHGPSRDLILAAIRRVDPEYTGVCVDEAP